MNIFKLMVILFCSINLTACGSGIRYANHKFKADQFHTGEKAVVLVRVSSKYKGWILRGETSVSYSFAKVDSNYPSLKTRHAYLVDGAWKNNYYAVLMVDPGIYVLETISYNMGDSDYYSAKDGLNPGKENFLYGGFNIKPGEVVYLGDINIDFHSKEKDIFVSDNLEKAKLFLNKKYPDLSTQTITTRLLDMGGSLEKYLGEVRK